LIETLTYDPVITQIGKDEEVAFSEYGDVGLAMLSMGAGIFFLSRSGYEIYQIAKRSTDDQPESIDAPEQPAEIDELAKNAQQLPDPGPEGVDTPEPGRRPEDQNPAALHRSDGGEARRTQQTPTEPSNRGGFLRRLFRR